MPPNGPPLAQFYLGSIHSRTRRVEHARIVSALGLFDISSSIHQVMYKALPLLRSQRRIRAASELTFDNKIASVWCRWMHSADLVSDTSKTPEMTHWLHVGELERRMTELSFVQAAQPAD